MNVNSPGLEPIEIGHQTWDGGRITTLALINANLSTLPKSMGELTRLKILHLERAER